MKLAQKRNGSLTSADVQNSLIMASRQLIPLQNCSHKDGEALQSSRRNAPIRFAAGCDLLRAISTPFARASAALQPLPQERRSSEPSFHHSVTSCRMCPWEGTSAPAPLPRRVSVTPSPRGVFLIPPATKPCQCAIHDKEWGLRLNRHFPGCSRRTPLSAPPCSTDCFPATPLQTRSTLASVRSALSGWHGDELFLLAELLRPRARSLCIYSLRSAEDGQ